MARRVILLMLVAVMAGSSVNWPCLFDCTASDPAAPEATCHQTTADGPRLTTGDDCTGERLHVSPFVKTDGFTFAIGPASPGTFAPRLTVRFADRPSVVAPRVGPPDGWAVIPLRI